MFGRSACIRQRTKGNSSLLRSHSRLEFEALEDRRLMAVVAEGDTYRVDAGSRIEAVSGLATESKQVFSSDFNTAPAPKEFSGTTSLATVRGYDGIGTDESRFSGWLLRNQTGMAYDFEDVSFSPVIATRLTLNNLPQHTSLDLNFLLAAIDSWDGNTSFDEVTPAADVFAVMVDGRVIFAETLDNHDPADQSYVPAPGVELAYLESLGYNSNYLDSAYDFGQEPAFNNIPHDSDSVRIEWFTYGDGWTGAYHEDESWGIDNVQVIANGVPLAAGVLANDLDSEGGELSAVLETSPQHGVLKLSTDGAFEYTPAPGFTGLDTFSYRAQGSGQMSEPVLVQFDVRAGAARPLAAPDTYSAILGQTLSTATSEVVKDLGTGFDQSSGDPIAEGAAEDDYRLSLGGPAGLSPPALSVLAGDQPMSDYLSNSVSGQSRWIGLGDGAAPGEYSFETKVDLTGYDPQSAYLAKLRIAVDDSLVGLWVDGVAVMTETTTGADYFRNLPDLGRGAFHAGVNTIRFVVRIDDSGDGALGLRIEGQVKARPTNGQPAGLLANDGLTSIGSAAGLYSVPATADPWLAGMPNGSTASSFDMSPEYSPTLVKNLQFKAGDSLQFAADGAASASHFISDYPAYGPDGGLLFGTESFWRHDQTEENGMSNIWAPASSLVGVFLDNSSPDRFTPPAMLDFRPTGNVAGGVDYELIRPSLRQMFFIGDGLNSDGTRQEVVVPFGATRLYLAVMDGYNWTDNVGRFDVRVFNDPASTPPNAKVVLDRGPEHGTLQLDPSGAFNYKAAAGYIGADSFRYRVQGADGYLTEYTTVKVDVAALTGDITGDGIVNLSDFGMMKVNFGYPGTRRQGDLNRDGLIDLVDFAMLKDVFGADGKGLRPTTSAIDAAFAMSLAAAAELDEESFFD